LWKHLSSRKVLFSRLHCNKALGEGWIAEKLLQTQWIVCGLASLNHPLCLSLPVREEGQKLHDAIISEQFNGLHEPVIVGWTLQLILESEKYRSGIAGQSSQRFGG